MPDGIDAHAFEPLFLEDEASIKARLLDPFVSDEDPERRHSTREGGFVNDWATIMSLEFLRAYDRVNQSLAVGFLVGATGDYLDQKGVELNLPRKGAASASVAITIEAAQGTVIPFGNRFTTTSTGDEEEVPVEFAVISEGTVGVSGVLVLEAVATVPGKLGNVAANTINQMVDLVPDVIYVTNAFDATGGDDEEGDSEYRGRLLEVLRAAGGPGTKADYVVWAREVLGVDDAIVFPHWDGGGTVKVVILGPDLTVPTTATLRAAQDYLDPSVAMIASMETDEGWTGGAFSDTSKSEGNTSLEINVPTGTTTTAALVRGEHLDYISSADTFSIWLDVVSGLANLTDIKFEVMDDVGLIAYRSVIATDLSIGPQNLEWTLAQMTVPGGFDWANIEQFSISVTTSAGGPMTVRADSWRVKDANGGIGQGKAPIGAQVTVSSARLLQVAVAATVVPAPGYTVSGLQPLIEDNISAYLAERRAISGYLYISEVANAINDTTGVLTYYNVRLNGQDVDLPTDSQDVPVLASLDLTL